MGYSIDMVVEGRGDQRLAIECDGDKYHGPERWLDKGGVRVLLIRLDEFAKTRALGLILKRLFKEATHDVHAILERGGIVQVCRFRGRELLPEDADGGGLSTCNPTTIHAARLGRSSALRPATSCHRRAQPGPASCARPEAGSSTCKARNRSRHTPLLAPLYNYVA